MIIKKKYKGCATYVWPNGAAQIHFVIIFLYFINHEKKISTLCVIH